MINRGMFRKSNLPELDDKAPLCLCENHEERNQDRVTAEYAVKYLIFTKAP